MKIEWPTFTASSTGPAVVWEVGRIKVASVKFSARYPRWARILDLEDLGNATRPIFGLLWEVE